MAEKMGQRLILKDGTIIENGSCGYSDGRLWCWFHGFTMAQAAQVFCDHEKTDHILYEYGEMTAEYAGFTDCRSLIVDNDGQISACLVKGAQNV